MTKPVWVFLDEVGAELERAQAAFPAMNSLHEGYAVLLEELDELWDEVKKKARLRDPEKLKSELVQVAAMATRIYVDLVAIGKVRD